MKNIIITGTSRGIGLELAVQLADAGHQILALSRQTPSRLLQHANVTCLSVDLSAPDFSLVEQFLKSWQHVDAIVHNAGALVLKPFAQTTAEDFQRIYRVNVFAVAALTQACLPYLKNGSHVVAISSIGGVQGSMKFAGLSAYSSSKGAVITLMELLAEEYREQGIAFNALALGSVQTDMLAEAFPGYQAPIQPADMARFIADFALNGQRFFNGKLLPVSSTTP
ncbi:SDR family NAD(P)-dependent oxidoreductase [Flavobacterium caeni]|uniref:NAD(P)-dependent dehydrogenase, short-chain alcohol dehydrogenase family n=1 Tax=Flavobacterium caeni TaxID=490189 RepID=A0A1G5F4G2_9FLAO|nr:SDR family oxidoreductase [Flavobacterium caeni]SCY34074.1 NAD(P)-dependent dehydrogenase, short-chain alcohol dehydrogenase family [Flavobacterium caeni]